MELNNLSTGSGDNGFSSLKNGKKIKKDSKVFEVLGTLDKTSSYIGVIKSMIKNQDIKKQLTYIQGLLYRIGSTIADPESSKERLSEKVLFSKLRKIERFESELLKKVHLKNIIIIPGKNLLSAHIDFTRTLCRELERKLVDYTYQEKVEHLKGFFPIVNRMSDYFYTLARYSENQTL